MLRAPVADARAIDGVTPRFSAQPSTAEELAAALRDANDEDLAVAAYGGGTQLDLGNVPRRLDVLLETSGLNHVVEYEPADLTVTVEAGMRFEALQTLLAEQGQFLALDPPADAEATIGGLIATNASGPLRFAYGTARDLVIGTRVANPEGTLTRAGGRVVKNVAGYDLNKLYVGSLGTLAIIVELSFKLAPIPPALATLAATFSSAADASRAVAEVLRSPLSPLALELLAPSAARAAGLDDAASLVVRVGGYSSAVERQLRDLATLATQHGGTRVETSDDVWQQLAAMRRDAFKREVVLKAAAPIAQSSVLLETLVGALDDLEPTAWVSAGNGVAYLGCSAPTSAAAIEGVRQHVRLLGSNASLVVQRCPLSLKQGLDVWGDPGPSLGLMRAIKEKLDPRGTLNPGRYVGGI